MLVSHRDRFCRRFCFWLQINDLLTCEPIHCYADDGTVRNCFLFDKPPKSTQFPTARRALKQGIDGYLQKVSSCGKNYLIEFNVSNTQSCLNSSKRDLNDNLVFFNGSNLPNKPSIDMIGATLSNQLRYGGSIEARVKLASQKLGVMYGSHRYCR